MGWKKPFGKENASLPEKITDPSAQDLKIQWEIPFIGQNALKKNFRMVIIKYFMRKMLSDLIVPQPENAWKWKCMFSGWGTSQGPKLNLREFFS